MTISNRLTGRGFSALRAMGALGLVGLLSFGCATDAVLGDDEKFMPDRVDEGGGGNGDLTPNDCDMTGTWIAQFRGRSNALGLIALSYNWFYYELEDVGDDVIIHRGWDCGFQVCGATSLALNNTQFDALALRNRQDGELFHNAASPDQSLVVERRPASYKKLNDGTCEFSMGRWWWLRSAPLDGYPDRESFATMTIPQIQAEKPLPPKGTLPTPENDWDGNHVPGLELRIDSPLQGTRDAAQRDWNEFGPGILPDGLDDFTVEARFDNEELLYEAQPSLLNQGSNPLKTGLTIRFVKIAEEAPEDIAGFRDFCSRQVAEHFRSAGADPEQYCAMRAQKLTELSSEDETENTDLD